MIKDPINIEYINAIAEDGKQVRVPIRRIAGRHLISRKDFLEHIENRGRTERLINKNLLVSYHCNGTRKVRRNGKLPNTRTFYCLKQWQSINYNEI